MTCRIGQISIVGAVRYCLELLQPVLANVDELAPPQRPALLRCLGLETGDTDEVAAHIALTVLLVELARQRPVLCVVDGAQWLDESSADAVLFAARRHPERVGFVFGVRDGLPSRFDEPWLAQVSIGALTEAESRALVEAGAPRLAPAVADRVMAAGEGNPLALLEFARCSRRNSGKPSVGPDRPPRLRKFRFVARSNNDVNTM